MIFNNYANSFSAFTMFNMGVFTVGAVLFFFLILAIVALKGYALWYSAKRNEKGWFIAMLLINTFGILELFYLYYVVEKWKDTPVPPSSASSTNAQ